MKRLNAAQLAHIEGGSQNCGNMLETYVIIKTCSVAGGFIGVAGGVTGVLVGMFAGKAACTWLCYYAS